MSGRSFELGTDGPSHILVGVDGTETSMRAAAYAAGMARRQNSTLIVLHVSSTSPLAAQSAATAGALAQAQAEIAQDIDIQVVQAARRLGIDAQYVLRRGNPYRELMAVAAQMRVDAVVIGASTRSGRRFVGSLAGRLVRDALWPVTVIP